MPRPKIAPYPERLRDAGARGAFGPNGGYVVEALSRVERLTNDQVERLARAQGAVHDSRGTDFFLAWHGVYEQAHVADVLAFQAVVSWAYGAADRRLAAGSLREEFSAGRASDFRHAVAGRALALFAGSGAPAGDQAILSAAWTAVLG